MSENPTKLGTGVRLSRRTALKLLFAAGVASRWDITQAVDSDAILRRRIPITGEMIPAVGLGTSDEFETDNDQSLEPLREVLRRFVDAGGTLVDTAPIYGNEIGRAHV